MELLPLAYIYYEEVVAYKGIRADDKSFMLFLLSLPHALLMRLSFLSAYLALRREPPSLCEIGPSCGDWNSYASFAVFSDEFAAAAAEVVNYPFTVVDFFFIDVFNYLWFVGVFWLNSETVMIIL